MLFPLWKRKNSLFLRHVFASNMNDRSGRKLAAIPASEAAQKNGTNFRKNFCNFAPE